jgi:hypothetical protein
MQPAGYNVAISVQQRRHMPGGVMAAVVGVRCIFHRTGNGEAAFLRQPAQRAYWCQRSSECNNIA